MFSVFRRRRHSSLEMQARPPVMAGRSEADMIESVAEGMVGMVVAAGFVVLDAQHANDYDFVLGFAGLGILKLLKRCGWRDRWVVSVS